MIDEIVILTLGLKRSNVQSGTSFINNCEIMIWPLEGAEWVYVMDCDASGTPLPEGFYMVIAQWMSGKTKILKECKANKKALLDPELRELIIKQITLSDG